MTWTGSFKKEVVHLPAPSESGQWHTFSLASFMPDDELRRHALSTNRIAACLGEIFFRFLPSLIHVVEGELCFVGVKPRTQTEVMALRKDWRSLYLKSKPGIVTEAFVIFGANAAEDEEYAAETYYTVSHSFLYDLKLVTKYFLRLFGIVR